MSLAPLLAAPLPVQIHAVAALGAFGLGIAQLVGRKGVLVHRILGWLWVLAMLVVAGSSFSIHEIRAWGRLEPHHLLSILTLVMLPPAVFAARRHRIGAHRFAMVGLFAGALMIAGVFTLLPGRLMHDVVF